MQTGVRTDPASGDLAVAIGSWIAKMVRRALDRPKSYKFRILMRDGQWRDEEASGYSRSDAREALRLKYEEAEDVLDR